MFELGTILDLWKGHLGKGSRAQCGNRTGSPVRRLSQGCMEKEHLLIKAAAGGEPPSSANYTDRQPRTGEEAQGENRQGDAEIFRESI